MDSQSGKSWLFGLGGGPGGDEKVFAVGTNAKNVASRVLGGVFSDDWAKQNVYSRNEKRCIPRPGGESAKTKFSCFFANSAFDLVPQLSW
jgi:hypothetical protein